MADPVGQVRIGLDKRKGNRAGCAHPALWNLVQCGSYLRYLRAAWAAASRATGTRNGEQLT